jgi:two-component sensor histidine kinase
MSSEKNIVHIQTEEAIIKTINRFCYSIILSCCFYLLIFCVFKQFIVAGAILVIALLFTWFIYLNKKSHYKISRAGIIITSSFGVATFSVLLGFNSGIFFYLFAAPHLIYLLFNFKEKKSLVVGIGVYILAFVFTYLVHYYQLIQPTIQLSDFLVSLMYAVNFCVSLILTFILITFFAKNNSTVSMHLEAINKSLEEKQHVLETEIAEKNKLNRKLETALKEKEILLSEIHHRVKNNLAVISGLIDLQNFYIKDEVASNMLKESRNRIKSIAVLHEKLYESKTLDRVHVKAFVDELIYYNSLSIPANMSNIKVHQHIDDVELDMEKALAFSLLLNELLTNAYKHAFFNKTEGNISITLKKTENKLQLTFSDDGIGFDAKKINNDSSLGLNLIEAFSNQLSGKLDVTSKEDQGTSYELEFQYI